MKIKELRIVELASVLAGPSVGMFFAEMGAKVLKVENKRENGDITRSWKLPSESKDATVSAYYSSVNYKKESVFLDFKDPKDKAQLLGFLKDCDVVIVNFKAYDDVKFGLTFEDLVQINPKIIYAKITGFESDNPRVAYDLVLQAESGLMYMNGQPDSLPTKFPVAIIDLFAAHQLKQGILVALYEQMFDGEAKKVSVSLFESALASLANQGSNFLMEEFVPKASGSLHPNIAPYGEIFYSKDNKPFTLAIGSDRQFVMLMDWLGLEVTAAFCNNQNRIENRSELQRVLEDKFALIASDEIKTTLEGKQIPFGFIKNLAEVFENPVARQMVLEEIIEGKNTKRLKTVAFRIES